MGAHGNFTGGMCDLGGSPHPPPTVSRLVALHILSQDTETLTLIKAHIAGNYGQQGDPGVPCREQPGRDPRLGWSALGRGIRHPTRRTGGAPRVCPRATASLHPKRNLRSEAGKVRVFKNES